MLKSILITLIIPFSFIPSLNSQSISIDGQSIGFIVINDSIISGSGFVMLKSNYVITCAHVIDSTKNIHFWPVKGEKQFKLKLIKYDIHNDLALLQSDSQISEKPLMPDVNYLVVPIQHIFYLGFNVNESNLNNKVLKVHQAYIEAAGSVFNGMRISNFIEFVGEGIPGYSGGPVFDDDGLVIGIMREAWFKQGVKGGETTLMNRAYSILPILRWLREL